jgi:hypothetical protein
MQDERSDSRMKEHPKSDAKMQNVESYANR